MCCFFLTSLFSEWTPMLQSFLNHTCGLVNAGVQMAASEVGLRRLLGCKLRHLCELIWACVCCCISVLGLWLVHRNLPHFATVAFQAKRWKAEKPPGVAGCTGCSGSPLFTFSGPAANVYWETLEKPEYVSAVLRPLSSGRRHTAPLFS